MTTTVAAPQLGSLFALPDRDVEDAVSNCAPDLSRWSGSRMLITGGTGVLGGWLLDTLLGANTSQGLKIDLSLVTRDRSRLPEVVASRKDVEVIEADVRTMRSGERFDLIVHGAAGASAPFGSRDTAPKEVASTIIDGTRRILEVASHNGARILYLSSGAVYGPCTGPVPEGHLGAPDPLAPRSAYGEAKRAAELFCGLATAEGAAEVVVARLFAFVGPRLPLRSYFAAGNFVADLCSGGPIHVQGDGRPRRSYLYLGDLPEWCFALATRGEPGAAYNVGSPHAVSIAELASTVASLGPERHGVVVHTEPQEVPVPWYVPDTKRARTELDLAPRVELVEGLSRWIRWLR